MSALLGGDPRQAAVAEAPQAPATRRPARGLFAKYFVFIVLLVGGGLVASGAIGLYFSYGETRQALVALQREKALTAAVRIEEFVRDIERQLGWTTLPPIPAAPTPEEQRRLDYLKLMRQVPAITEVSYLDGEGREALRISRLSMDTAGSGTSYAVEPRFVEARKGRTWFGPVWFRQETEPAMSIAIREARDRPGVTVADVNLKFIWDVVSRIRIGQEGVAYVVDERGLLVAHPDISLVLRKTDLSSLPQVREALAARADASWTAPADARDPQGRRVISAYAAIESTGWRVFVEEPESAVLAPLYAALVRTALLLLAGVVLSVIASLVLARRMVRPVRALREGAERIGAGDLTRRIDVRTGDELEDLAGRFNTMTAQLAESYADLERKVEARTAELREALEQQTATSQVLSVISTTTTDAAPVFDAIVRAASQLANAPLVYLVLRDGAGLRAVAGTVPLLRDEAPLDRATLAGQVILDEHVVAVPDWDTDPDLDARFGGDFRRGLGVPLAREGHVLGALVARWKTAGTIDEKHARMLRTFADQAVIAIENVRLFNEIERKSRQLEVANRHKSEFLANMSHELRTPLNAIIGFGDVLVSGMAGPMDEKQREFVGDIRDSGKHLLALINDILDLSKIEAGRMELDVARFELRDAVDNAMTLVRGRAERNGVALVTEIGADVGGCEADERKLKQILVNLLSNAVKFTPAGGTVTLGVRRERDGYLFWVADTGVGIAPEHQALIFEEFRQVGSDYARKAEGTGLGLSLTKRLVELHGGSLRVQSAPGEGSTFTFDLPGSAS